MAAKRGEGYKIRLRSVRSRKPGEHPWNDEYQVVSGSRIIQRFDMLSQALGGYPGADLDVTVVHEETIRKANRR